MGSTACVVTATALVFSPNPVTCGRSRLEGRDGKKSEAFRPGPTSCYDPPGLGTMRWAMGRRDGHSLSVNPTVDEARTFWRLNDSAMKERILRSQVPKGTGRDPLGAPQKSPLFSVMRRDSVEFPVGRHLRPPVALDGAIHWARCGLAWRPVPKEKTGRKSQRGVPHHAKRG